MFEELLTTYGYLGVFVVSLGVNLIPFSSPSNLVIAGATTFLLPQMNPLLVGLAVAVAASAAKTGHYYVAAYLGGKAGKRRRSLLPSGGVLVDGVHLLSLWPRQLPYLMIARAHHLMGYFNQRSLPLIIALLEGQPCACHARFIIKEILKGRLRRRITRMNIHERIRLLMALK